MSVSGVNNNAGVSTVVAAATSNTSKTTAATDSSADLYDALLKEDADTYEKGDTTTKPKTYTRDTVKLAELNEGQKAYIKNLQSLVSELVNQVGKNQSASGANKFSASFSGGIDASKVESYWDLLVDNGDGTYSLDPSLSAEDQDKIIAQAQEDISENGYYGVKQTSQRILDFAKAVTGGDPSKIGEMREIVQKSFDDVEKIMGGKLPQLSQDTYDAVMKGFDEWEASAKTTKTSE